VSSSKLSSGEVADIFTAAMASGTTDTFFEALDAADKAASDANFNAHGTIYAALTQQADL
jgi:hypothetical protein